MQVQMNISRRIGGPISDALRTRQCAIVFASETARKEQLLWLCTSVLFTVKRGDAAMAEAQKLGMKITEEFWTMGAYDVVVMFDAPNDETMSAFMLKIGSLGNVKSQTLRAFRREEMENILAKIK
jgi:uncharacterized protein with GYD domain